MSNQFQFTEVSIMFILSGILNVIAALLLVWWSFGALNNILLLIPALIFMAVGCMCIGKAIKKQ